MIYLRDILDGPLRIFTGRKHPKINLQRKRNIRIWTFGLLVHQINSLRVTKTGKNTPKNKVVTGKPLLFVIGRFVVAILFILTLVSGRAVLNGNGVFSISVVSTKKLYSSFFKKVFFFLESLFQS